LGLFDDFFFPLGESLFNTSGLSCYFGDSVVHAYHITEDEAICKAPASHNTSLLYETSLSVYLGDGTKKSNEVPFFYFGYSEHIFSHYLLTRAFFYQHLLS